LDNSGNEQATSHEDERRILDTLHRYAHRIDYGPMDDWLDCFTDDAVWRTRRGRYAVEGASERLVKGRAELAELFSSFEHALTKHVVVTPLLEIDGDRCIAHSYFMTPTAHPTGPFLLAFGRLRDRLVRCPDGRWRFEERLCEVDGTHPLAEPLVGPDISQSVVIEEIKRLKARYCHFLDAQRWADWAELFTEDARIQLGSRRGEEDLEGRAAIRAGVSSMLDGFVTVHQVVMPDIEIGPVLDAHLGWDARLRMHPEQMGPTSAHGTWGTFSIAVAGTDGDAGACERVWGRHDEDYERGADGRWRIRSLYVTELRVERD
jgi:3-phenylpropionate/cinnamic acid dioxygenase small subunit